MYEVVGDGGQVVAVQLQALQAAQAADALGEGLQQVVAQDQGVLVRMQKNASFDYTGAVPDKQLID